MLLGELLESLQRLLREVDVLDGQETGAKAGEGTVVHDAGAGRRQHVREVREGARGEEHGVRVVLRVELRDQQRNKRVHGEVAVGEGERATRNKSNQYSRTS